MGEIAYGLGAFDSRWSHRIERLGVLLQAP